MANWHDEPCPECDHAYGHAQACSRWSQCAECRHFYGGHKLDCSLITVEFLKSQLIKMREMEMHNSRARQIQRNREKDLLTLWQGKFHALRHENNQLRKKLRLTGGEK